MWWLLLSLPMVSSIWGGRLQSIAVNGTLLCNGIPASDIPVKLYDQDTFDPNDLLDSVKTDENGFFQVSGWEVEVTAIDPVIEVHHDCEEYVEMCQRRYFVTIPDSYISESKTPSRTFNLGQVELAARQDGIFDTWDCIFY